MLDVETRRRIDTARDILVGKVPDPKSQVEQITIALIYKFMNDMDAESEELGGERAFFAGEFARYAWPHLILPGLSGHEVLNLYAEAIGRMPENQGVPPLFRDIFKNAYLPYRDPETLRAFLKVINEFTYDHSERLGDAFEYLLSVLGSQGDAGQFRTPRHIIDFIVAIVDPKKDEKVLDPACGTAGFLISSFKHIQQANRDATGNSTLSPDDRAKLATNFVGYDISPDMVRLSLVNLYLHGFNSPQIYEYDTLTSNERWNDYFDVILANPPFMSPKGGIRPHNRFSVQSKRSEVLFVDYIAEHLTANGRAGIIVPEGVIFQSQNAYKQMRKMVLEQSLVAVVSLPAGIFNPYSGVKTSILIFDNALAKRSSTVAFFKIENDGFGLGAQRRAIEANDLPTALTEAQEYLRRLRTGESLDDFQPAHGHVVSKEKIAASREYNLSGERYRENGHRQYAYPLIPLNEVCIINPPKAEGLSLPGETVVSFVPMADMGEHSMNFVPTQTRRVEEMGSSYTYFADGDVLVAKVTPCFENGKAGIAKGLMNGVGFGSSEFYVLRPGEEVLPEFLYFCLMHPTFRVPAIEQMTGTGGLQRVPKAFVERFEIPLPPLEVQQEIVAEIEGYQRVIDGARMVVENYRPHITVDPEWPLVELGEICSTIQYGLSSPLNTNGVGFKTFRMNELDEGKCVDRGNMKYADVTASEFAKYRLDPGDILFNRTNSFEHVGRTGVFALKGEYCFASYLIRLIIEEQRANPFYVNALMNTEGFQNGIKQYASRAIGQSNINAKNLSTYRIPLPTLGVQEEIVAEIDAEQSLVAASRELITRFETKIQTVLDRVWGFKGKTS